MRYYYHSLTKICIFDNKKKIKTIVVHCQVRNERETVLILDDIRNEALKIFVNKNNRKLKIPK